MRKIFLIQDELQLRYLKLLLISIILPTLFVSSCLYYLIFTILAENLGIPEVITVHLMPVIQKINGMLLIGLPIIMIILVIWGLALSNRLAGPITRMRKEMDEIIKGDYSKRIKIRKEDDLYPIANEINTLLDKIEQLQLN